MAMEAFLWPCPGKEANLQSHPIANITDNSSWWEDMTKASRQSHNSSTAKLGLGISQHSYATVPNQWHCSWPHSMSIRPTQIETLIASPICPRMMSAHLSRTLSWADCEGPSLLKWTCEGWNRTHIQMCIPIEGIKNHEEASEHDAYSQETNEALLVIKRYQR